MRALVFVGLIYFGIHTGPVLKMNSNFIGHSIDEKFGLSANFGPSTLDGNG